MILLMISTSLVFAKKKKIVVKQSGSKDGIHYNTVDEYHNWQSDFHSLKCKNPGSIVCTWGHTPRVKGSSGNEYDVNQLTSIAYKKVEEYFTNYPNDKNFKIKLQIDGITIDIHAKKDNDQSLDITYTILEEIE